MQLEVVVHASGEKCAGYLAWFLHSLTKHPPRRRHTVEVSLVADGWSWGLADVLDMHNATVWTPVDSHLCNRAIERDRMARKTSADWLWFTDASYAVGPRFLTRACDRLAALPADVPVAYPRKIRQCSPLTARRLAAAGLANYQALGTLDDKDFPAVRCGCNDQGVLLSSFFVRGDVARAKGYLADRPELLKPADDGQWVPQAMRDWLYLKSVLGKSRPAGFYARWLYRMGS